MTEHLAHVRSDWALEDDLRGDNRKNQASKEENTDERRHFTATKQSSPGVINAK